jgi:hypothetical protein
MLVLVNFANRPVDWALLYDFRTTVSTLFIGLVATIGRLIREVQKEGE